MAIMIPFFQQVTGAPLVLRNDVPSFPAVRAVLRANTHHVVCLSAQRFPEPARVCCFPASPKGVAPTCVCHSGAPCF